MQVNSFLALAMTMVLGVTSARAGISVRTYLDVAGTGGADGVYVNTGFKPGYNTIIRAGYQDASTGNACLLCSRKASGTNTAANKLFDFFPNVSNKTRFDYYINSYAGATITSYKNEDLSLVISNGYSSVYRDSTGGVIDNKKGPGLKSAFGTPEFPLVLLACYTMDGSNPSSFSSAFIGRFYYLEVYSADNVLLHEYRPADVDGTTMIYDLVTGDTFPITAFGNGATVKLGEDVLSGRIVVAGSPDCHGTPEPGYGLRTGLASGESCTFTAPAAWTNANETFAAECSGWELKRVDGVTTTGSGSSMTFTYSPEYLRATLTWQWTEKEKCTAAVSAAGGGSVSPSEQWVVKGQEPAFTATPDSGWEFVRWEVDGTSHTAVFGYGYYVDAENGDDSYDGLSAATAWKHLQHAVDTAPEDSRINVLPGNYTSTDNTEGSFVLTVNKRVSLISTGGRAVTFIDAGTDRSRAELKVTAAGALVKGFTIKNGNHYSKAKFGGVQMSNGTVEDCDISVRGQWAYKMLDLSGSAKLYNVTLKPVGGEGNYMIYAQGNAVIDRVIVRPGDWSNGNNPIYLTGNAVLRNARIYGCTNSTANAYIKLDGSGARLESSTIVKCHSKAAGVPVQINNNSATVTNCILWANTAATAAYRDFMGNSRVSRVFDSCSDQLTDGVNGNIIINPQFTDLEAGDLTLKPVSPCVNHSTVPAAEDPLVGTLDVAGNNRVFGASLDMGAYECQIDPASAPLDVVFNSDVYTSASGSSLSPVFTASAVGNLSNATIIWDFGDGTTADTWPTATHTYETPGRYTVTLTVDNGVESKTFAYNDCITVVPAVCYVSHEGSGTYPYDSWEKATDDVEAALQVRSAEVQVADGEYTSTVSEHLISWPVYLHSTNGAATTVHKTKSGNVDKRHFRLTDPGARVSGFTLSGGYSANYSYHASFTMSAGQIDHCIITNIARLSRSAIGYMSGGKLLDCDIDGRGWANGNGDGKQVALHLEGSALVERCKIHNHNGLTRQNNTHTAVYMNGANVVVRNCLIYDNTRGKNDVNANSNGGGVWIDNGTLENCTVANNVCGGRGGGVYVSGSSGNIINCIIYGNTAKLDYGNDIYAKSLDASKITYTCASDLADLNAVKNGGGTGCSTANPQFDEGNPYHLTSKSVACVDSGFLTDAAQVEGATDLDGNPRVDEVNELIDMGCFEYIPSGEKELLSATIDYDVPDGVGRAPFELGMKANLFGDTEGLTYAWDFGDGNVCSDTLSPTNTYVEPGVYTVSLALQNTAGESTNIVSSVKIVAVPPVCYVATNGTSVVPYDTLEKAATNLADAVALRPRTVLVDEGVHKVSGLAITVNSDTMIKSMKGPSVTTIDGCGVARDFILKIDHKDASLEGFTIVNGDGTWGGAITINANHGLVSNCVFTANQGTAHYRDHFFNAGGDALIVDSVFIPGRVGIGNPDAELMYATVIGGSTVVDRCIISNYVHASNHHGTSFAVRLEGSAVMRNTLIADCHYRGTTANNNGYSYSTGVVGISDNAKLISCTVAGCSFTTTTTTSSTGKMPICVYGGVVSNCVFGSNTAFDVPGDVYKTGGKIGCTRYTEADGANGNINADPRFRNPARQNWRLKSSSPCVNAADWTVLGPTKDAVRALRDLNGDPRLLCDNVDMGCFETAQPLMLLVR